MNYRETNSTVFKKRYFRNRTDENVCELLELQSGLTIVRLTTYEQKFGSKNYVEY